VGLLLVKLVTQNHKSMTMHDQNDALSYTAWKVILESPNGSSNKTFQAVYSSKYIPVW